MAVDLNLLARKVRRYREQFEMSIEAVAEATGIRDLSEIEEARRAPTGDEILILADFFKCDYRFLISNEQAASIDQTEKLFRKHGAAFSPRDRWALQECLFLSECEAFLQGVLEKQKLSFAATKTGGFFKAQGQKAAADLRTALGYTSAEIPSDVFADFRRIGVHIFRRKLENSNISGVYVRHPFAGSCVMVNYSEDLFRQRFTAAHEAAHALLDVDEDFVVTFEHQGKDLREVRANAFAARYLVPPDFLQGVQSDFRLTSDQAVEWATKLKVNTFTLALALKDAELIDDNRRGIIAKGRVPREAKIDAELPLHLPTRTLERKRTMIERGLSDSYVNLCFEAYDRAEVSAARLSEMLLLSCEAELHEVLDMYSEKLQYGS
jgi:Zn-dependent peptidase ImmA (M78 family)/transcriptional regulator with XRE-family HTH domain